MKTIMIQVLDRNQLLFCLMFIFTSLSIISCHKENPVPTTEASLSIVSTYINSNTFPYKNLSGIAGIAIDTMDNLYIADGVANCIRKVSADGKTVSTFAGSGEFGLKDGPAATAAFQNPLALTFDDDGNLYITQPGAVRKITPAGMVFTLAGNGSDSSFVFHPYGITVDDNKNVYYTSFIVTSGQVAKITPDKKITTFAGYTISSSSSNNIVPKIQLNTPYAVVFNPVQKNLYVMDAVEGVIKIGLDGTGGCISGCGTFGHIDGSIATAKFGGPGGGICDKAGNVYVGDAHSIRKITPNGIVSTVAGSTIKGYKDGTGDVAQFSDPTYFALDSKGNLYVTDAAGIRKIILTK